MALISSVCETCATSFIAKLPVSARRPARFCSRQCYGKRRPAPQTIDLSRPLSEQPALLRLSEAAALMRRSTRALARWEAKGLLKVHRPAGGSPLVPRAELERLLSQGT